MLEAPCFQGKMEWVQGMVGGLANEVDLLACYKRPLRPGPSQTTRAMIGGKKAFQV